MKPSLKYVIWLRNILAILLAIVLIDTIIKTYYDHTTARGLSYGPIMGIFSLLALQYYIRTEQRNERND